MYVYARGRLRGRSRAIDVVVDVAVDVAVDVLGRGPDSPSRISNSITSKAPPKIMLRRLPPRLKYFVTSIFFAAASLTLAVTLAVIPNAVAGQEAATFTTKAQRAILMDASTGAVLFQLKADELAPPASMSKLMTLAVLFRAIKAGQIKGTDEFVMSVNAWRNGGAPSGTSAMMVPVNTKVTRR